MLRPLFVTVQPSKILVSYGGAIQCVDMSQLARRQSGLSWDWVEIPAGEFQMGSPDFYPEEAPVTTRSVDSFWIASTPVTNADFARFVESTGYVTVAERAANDEVGPGSLVFQPTPGPVDLTDWRAWWRWQPGAYWRQPEGPGSTIDGRGSHPVVQICYDDAVAFCEWANCRLPTEAEHEYAACGGQQPAPYAWGSERFPNGEVMANTWHGLFPYDNHGALGWVGRSPVGSFPPNGYGLLDMIGNVWEWTSSIYQSTHEDTRDNNNCAANTTDASTAEDGPAQSSCCSPSIVTEAPKRVLKGGSHLCAPEYCLRYRPAARSPQAEDSGATHIGMRCVLV